MRLLRWLCLITLCLLALPVVAAERWTESGVPQIRQFGSADYQAHGQNWAFAQAPDGLLYFGNTEGVLQFDGVRWQLWQMPNRSIVRSLAVDPQSGRIYIGAAGELGYLQPDAAGALQYHSLLKDIPPAQRNFSDVWQTFVTPAGVYFASHQWLFRINPDGSIKSWKAGKRFHRAYWLNNRLLIRADGLGLLALNDKDELSLVPGGEVFASDLLNALFDWPAAGGIIAISRSSGFYRYTGQRFEPWHTELSVFLKDRLFYTALLLPDGRLALGQLQGGIDLMDAAGRYVGRFDKAHGLRDDAVYQLGLDHEHGLWVGSNSGLSRVQLGSALSQFDERHGLSGTLYITGRIHGQLFAGTSQGLFRLMPGPEPKFSKVEGLSGQVWALQAWQDQVLVGNYQGLFRIAQGKTELIRSGDSTASLLLLQGDSPRLLAGERAGVSVFTARDGHWDYHGAIAGVQDNIRSMVQTGPAELWLGTFNNGVIRLVYPSGQLLQGVAQHTVFGLPEGLPGQNGNRVILLDGQLRVLTDQGIYQLSGAGNRFAADPRFRGLFGGEIRSVSRLLETPHGLWLDSRNETDRRSEVGFASKGADGRYQWQPLLEFGNIRLSTWHQDPDGTLWLGSDQLHRLESTAPETTAHLRLLLRTISDGSGMQLDTVTPNPQFSAAQNQLRFSVVAPSYRGDNLYAYWLEGVDSGWSGWHSEAFASYNNLWEGQYRFKAKALDPLGVEHQMTPLQFQIAPPLFRTLWAYLMYIALVLLAINRWYHWRSARLRASALVLEQQVSTRTAELQQTLTSLKSTQSQLVRAEKMAALGQLVAGVAHEVNTPLGVALTGSSYLRESTAALAETLNSGQLRKQDLAQYLDTAVESSALIERNLQRAADLISNFKQVSVDRSSGERRQFQLQSFLTEVAQSLKTLWRNRPLELVVDCPVDLVMQSYPGSLSQVITMLAQNSLLHAFAPDQAGQMNLVVRQPDANHCEISFADNGCGIAAEHLDKIFEPFFTTKRAHGGTGLGLHILFNLVTARLGGTVTVESQPGAGCRFILLLPLIAPAPETTTAADAAVELGH